MGVSEIDHLGAELLVQFEAVMVVDDDDLLGAHQRGALNGGK